MATPNKYRSGLEKNIGSDLDAKGVGTAPEISNVVKLELKAS